MFQSAIPMGNQLSWSGSSLIQNASLDVLLLFHLTADAGHGRRGLEVGPAEAQTQAVAQRGRRGSLEPGPQFNASISA